MSDGTAIPRGGRVAGSHQTTTESSSHGARGQGEGAGCAYAGSSRGALGGYGARPQRRARMLGGQMRRTAAALLAGGAVVASLAAAAVASAAGHEPAVRLPVPATHSVRVVPLQATPIPGVVVSPMIPAAPLTSPAP